MPSCALGGKTQCRPPWQQGCSTARHRTAGSPSRALLPTSKGCSQSSGRAPSASCQGCELTACQCDVSQAMSSRLPRAAAQPGTCLLSTMLWGLANACTAQKIGNLNLSLACLQEWQPQSDHNAFTERWLFFFNEIKLNSCSNSDFNSRQEVWCIQESFEIKNQEPTSSRELWDTFCKSSQSAFKQGTQPPGGILLPERCCCGLHSQVASNWLQIIVTQRLIQHFTAFNINCFPPHFHRQNNHLNPVSHQ